jgi:hypothetical protein
MDVEKLSLLPANGYAVSRDLNPKLVPVASCTPLGRETRKHPPGQMRKLADSLDQFGFVLPILIDLIPDKTFAAFNLTYAPAFTRTDGTWRQKTPLKSPLPSRRQSLTTFFWARKSAT